MALLSIVIGIVFVMLLFSLLATSIMEILAGVFALRGRHLLEAIQIMIGDATQVFTNHPFFRQLSLGTSLKATSGAFPAYIGSGTFTAILMDILALNNAEEVEARLDSMAEGPLKQLLLFLYREAGGDLLAFRKKVEEWFNEVMDRASGAYKRKTRRWLIGVGMSLALIFNVDPIAVYTNLSLNAALREDITNMATLYVQNNSSAVSPTAGAQTYQEGRDKVITFFNENIAAIASPLGLGWTDVNWSTADGRWWLYKVVGWITTAIAISLGATFWFDLLKMLVSIRSSGPPPSQTAASGLTPTPSTLGSTGGSFFTKPGNDIPWDSRSARKPQEVTTRGAQKPPEQRAPKKPPREEGTQTPPTRTQDRRDPRPPRRDTE